MPVLIALGALLLLVLILGPQIWVRRVLRQHGAERPDFPGTGAELARHLLDDLKHVQRRLQGEGGATNSLPSEWQNPVPRKSGSNRKTGDATGAPTRPMRRRRPGGSPTAR